jgi:hypothetical protein
MHCVLQQSNITLDIRTQWTGPPIVLLCLCLISPQKWRVLSESWGRRKEGRSLFNAPTMQLRPCDASTTRRSFNTAHSDPSTAVFLLTFTLMGDKRKRALNADWRGRRNMELLKKNKIFNETETRNIAHPTNINREKNNNKFQIYFALHTACEWYNTCVH